MKKNLLSILCGIILSCTMAQAQENTNSFYQNSLIKRFFVEFDVSGTTTNKDTRMMTVGAKLGFDITPRLYAFARYEGLTAMNDANGDKSYANTTNLGGGLGLRLFNINMSDGKHLYDGNMSVYAMMAASVGNTDMKQTVYEGGLKWKLRKGLSPTIGLGFRHTNSHTSGMPNHNSLIGSIGLCF